MSMQCADHFYLSRWQSEGEGNSKRVGKPEKVKSTNKTSTVRFEITA